MIDDIWDYNRHDMTRPITPSERMMRYTMDIICAAYNMMTMVYRRASSSTRPFHFNYSLLLQCQQTHHHRC